MDTAVYVRRVKAILEKATGRAINEDTVIDYIDNWYAAKEKWIKRFGDNTIFTYPNVVECPMDEVARLRSIKDFLRKAFHYASYFKYSFNLFEKFVLAQGALAVENKVAEEFILPDETVIPAGMKLLRAFKFFIEDKDKLSLIQDAMNLVISQHKLTGYLHFSVDPLDYLSISENSYGWRSCHSLDGDYAAGNLEYMMDESTIICYIDDNTQTTISMFPEDIPWNSKKWRMLLFSNDDGTTIFAGRQYPNALENIMPVVYKVFKLLLPNIYFDCAWDNHYIMEYPAINLSEDHIISDFDGRIYPVSSIYREKNPSGHLFYDDILCSSVYRKPYYLFGFNSCTRNKSRSMNPVIVGVDQVLCPCCGKAIINSGADLLMCFNCADNNEDAYICECCGHHSFNEDEGGWLVNDVWWCSRCIADNAVTCADCGGLCNIEDAVYDERHDKYYCQYCSEYDGRNEEE